MANPVSGWILKGIQNYACEKYGAQGYTEIVENAGVIVSDFDVLNHYDFWIAEKFIKAIAAHADCSLPDMLQDFGAHIVQADDMKVLRRLLRFGGVDFEDFVNSLSDLPMRTSFAIPDLQLPQFELISVNAGVYVVDCGENIYASYVLVGLLQAMAQDYGTLCEIKPITSANAWVQVKIQNLHHHPPREFSLLGGA